MLTNQRRSRLAVALVLALALTAGAAAACSARATGGAAAAVTSGAAPASSPAPDGGPTQMAAKTGAGDDWSRIAAALAWMKAGYRREPVVVLLGGSAARESTISDQSWRAQITADGGPTTLAWNMGSHNRTMAQDIAIVKALPKDARALVLIGINLGSFTSSQRAAGVDLPSPAPTAPPSLNQPHQYGVATTGVLPADKKRAMARQWLSTRYPVYKANFNRNAALLETLVKLCRTRGYKPVLLELPRNTQVIGSALDAPTAKFRDTCRSLAAKYSIPWVSLVSRAKIPSRDFYDIWHLVEPGRAVWQTLLSARTTALLKQYGFDGGP
jgi:hypothetical protein